MNQQDIDTCIDVAEKTMNQCINLINTKKHSLPYPVMHPEVKISTRKNGASHAMKRGKKSHIQIALRACIPPRDANGPYAYREVFYHPIFGAFLTNEWTDLGRATTCHECAHIAQFYQDSNVLPIFKHAHGKGW